MLTEQKGKDLILITQISYFILLIKIPDKDLLQHFVALPKLSGEVLFSGLGSVFWILPLTENVVRYLPIYSMHGLERLPPHHPDPRCKAFLQEI